MALARVAVGHERQRRHAGPERLAAHHQIDWRPRRRAGLRQITHGDRTVDAGTEAARGDGAETFPQQRQDFATLPRWGAPVRPNANPPPLCSLRQLLADAARTQKPAFGPSALLDGPGKAGLDRARRLVDIMPV